MGKFETQQISPISGDECLIFGAFFKFFQKNEKKVLDLGTIIALMGLEITVKLACSAFPAVSAPNNISPLPLASALHFNHARRNIFQTIKDHYARFP
jgi:hypothetical protein